ncbi:MAG: DUF4870 domain-containing protein [Pyrinomonadaceae bacterium]
METQKSAIGLDGNIAALIGWIIGILALILIFIEKDNKFVKFHAVQSVLFHVGFFVIYFALSILVVVLSQVSSAFGLLGFILLPLWLVWLGGMIFGAVKAFKGEMFKYPIIGGMAEKWSN